MFDCAVFCFLAGKVAEECLQKKCYFCCQVPGKHCWQERAERCRGGQLALVLAVRDSAESKWTQRVKFGIIQEACYPQTVVWLLCECICRSPRSREGGVIIEGFFCLLLLILIAASQDKCTPLHCATDGNKADCVLHLLHAGANPDQPDIVGYGDISIYYSTLIINFLETHCMKKTKSMLANCWKSAQCARYRAFSQ